MAQSKPVGFVVTETFRSETQQERKETLQQMIDAYLSMKIHVQSFC